MQRTLSNLICLVMLLAMPVSSAYGQFFAPCSNGSEQELDRAIAAHEEHMWRLYYKFVTGWYHQGEMPDDFVAATRDDLVGYLETLAPAHPAAVFYGFNETAGRLCTWLISSDGSVLSHVAAVPKSEFASLQRRLFVAVGGRGVGLSPSATPDGTGSVLARARDLLLPEGILEVLVDGQIDLLVIVPIFALGSVPYAALPVGDKALVDLTSVVVAPGFFSLRGAAPKPDRDFSKAVILGDPDVEAGLQPLPWARLEATEVARLVDTEPLVGSEATKAALIHAITSSTGLIYIAAHGTASENDPRDASMLHLSDGPLAAAEVDDFGKRLEGAQPLVVLSACGTGLGKYFDVGTIGMARAWQRAGAPSVLMSLWNVDDKATRFLMTRFIEEARHHPPDRALQRAMKFARETNDDPYLWASFAIFGKPEARF